jgi:hypothetical protein
MIIGHSDAASGACRRTPNARDSDASALGHLAPSENSVELTASVRRWLTESRRAAPLPDRRPTTSTATATTVTATAAAPQRGPSAGVSDSRVALLVDPAGLDREALAEVLSAVHASYDRPVVRRAYADWTPPGSREQLDILGDHAVQPVHAFASGFGHTIVALTVDALDAVGTYGVDCVVVVADLEAVQPLVIPSAGVGHASAGRRSGHHTTVLAQPGRRFHRDRRARPLGCPAGSGETPPRAHRRAGLRRPGDVRPPLATACAPGAVQSPSPSRCCPGRPAIVPPQQSGRAG